MDLNNSPIFFLISVPQTLLFNLALRQTLLTINVSLRIIEHKRCKQHGVQFKYLTQIIP